MEIVRLKIGFIIAIIVAATLGALSGCSGWAFVPVPEPGWRTSITTEARINSTFENGIESAAQEAVDPVGFFRKRR